MFTAPYVITDLQRSRPTFFAELPPLLRLGAPIRALCAAQDLFLDSGGDSPQVHADPLCSAARRPVRVGDPLDMVGLGSLRFCPHCQESYPLEQGLLAWSDVIRLQAEVDLARKCLLQRASAYYLDASARAVLSAQLILSHVTHHGPSLDADVPTEVSTWRAAGLAALAAQLAGQRATGVIQWRSRPVGRTDQLLAFTGLWDLADGSMSDTVGTALRRGAAGGIPVAQSPTLAWMVVRSPELLTSPSWADHPPARARVVTLGAADEVTDPLVWDLLDRAAADTPPDFAVAFDVAQRAAAAPLSAGAREVLDTLGVTAAHVSLARALEAAPDLSEMGDPVAALTAFGHLAQASPALGVAELLRVTAGVVAPG